MKRAIPRIAVVLVLLAAVITVASLQIPIVSFLLRAALFGAATVFVLWLLWRAYQAFLWKVGRRLAFSYFLIGALPIPMLALLAVCVAYVLGSFFLGHLYRDTLTRFDLELATTTRDRLADLAAGRRPETPADARTTYAFYRDGKRVGGDSRAPAAWPAWLASAPEAATDGRVAETMARFVAWGDGSLTLAVATAESRFGVVGLYAGDLAAALSDSTGVWVRIRPSDQPGERPPDQVTLPGGELTLRAPGASRAPPEEKAERQAFFAKRAKGESVWDRPLVGWVQLSGPLHSLDRGEVLSRDVRADLMGTPRGIVDRLFSTSSEIDVAAWIALAGVGGVLLFLYACAVLVALFMIFGLSRAVNRMSRATTSVQAGDFSVRIPVRRRDQLGALQRSFNQMAENLQGMVATVAQKEVLEKELEIARELQESLLPGDLPHGEAVEFATLFEPSAVIGGDYFDILRVDEAHLAVVIADVSGHGLSSGLRMAMLKAALLILIEERKQTDEILRRLDALVRSSGDPRSFVTATLSLVDFRTGHTELTNAGHPPTYLLRGGEVEEILLPGSPLGGIGHTYGHRQLDLEPGDVLVWLSDGLIEATDAADEPFGYEGVVAALRGPAASAEEVRGRLLGAVHAHVGERPAEDDRTLVVMSYRGAVASPTSPSRA